MTRAPSGAGRTACWGPPGFRAPGRGGAAPPPGTPWPTAAPRLPPAPSARPSPHPVARGGPSAGWPGAPRAEHPRRAPGAGMRPSRGLHNGAGPLQSGARDSLAHAGRRRSPAVDTLGDPVPLQGAAELTAVGVPPLHPPAGGPVPAPRRRSRLSPQPPPPARPASGLDSTPAAGHTDMEPAPRGGGPGGGAPSLLRLRKQRNDNSGARPPRTSQPPAPPP